MAPSVRRRGGRDRVRAGCSTHGFGVLNVDASALSLSKGFDRLNPNGAQDTKADP